MCCAVVVFKKELEDVEVIVPPNIIFLSLLERISPEMVKRPLMSLLALPVCELPETSLYANTLTSPAETSSADVKEILPISSVKPAKLEAKEAAASVRIFLRESGT